MENIMITGGTGYVGSWVTKKLLEKGYNVRLTVRNKTDEYKYAHLTEIAKFSTGSLEIWEADLLKQGSYDQAAEGCSAIMHIASPFSLRIKDVQKELIDPALGGTKNVLKAAAKSSTVKKVILTSSIVAVFGDNIDMKNSGISAFTEDHFNITSSISHQPYAYSKVLAEKEAWKMSDAQEKYKLIVINPGFVMGPSLTKSSDSESIHFMKNMLIGTYRMGAPDQMFGYVDVRDVADAHVLALENPKASGRNIIVGETLGLYKFSKLIKSIYGSKYKLPLMQAPKFVLYLVGSQFGLTKKYISNNVGHDIAINSDKSRKQLGVIYTPLEKTIEDMVEQMEAFGLI